MTGFNEGEDPSEKKMWYVYDTDREGYTDPKTVLGFDDYTDACAEFDRRCPEKGCSRSEGRLHGTPHLSFASYSELCPATSYFVEWRTVARHASGAILYDEEDDGSVCDGPLFDTAEEAVDWMYGAAKASQIVVDPSPSAGRVIRKVYEVYMDSDERPAMPIGKLDALHTHSKLYEAVNDGLRAQSSQHPLALLDALNYQLGEGWQWEPFIECEEVSKPAQEAYLVTTDNLGEVEICITREHPDGTVDVEASIPEKSCEGKWKGLFSSGMDAVFKWLLASGAEIASDRYLWHSMHYIADVMIEKGKTPSDLLEEAAAMTPEELASWRSFVFGS